jgi:hypothetical protein
VIAQPLHGCLSDQPDAAVIVIMMQGVKALQDRASLLQLALRVPVMLDCLQNDSKAAFV